MRARCTLARHKPVGGWHCGSRRPPRRACWGWLNLASARPRVRTPIAFESLRSHRARAPDHPFQARSGNNPCTSPPVPPLRDGRLAGRASGCGLQARVAEGGLGRRWAGAVGPDWLWLGPSKPLELECPQPRSRAARTLQAALNDQQPGEPSQAANLVARVAADLQCLLQPSQQAPLAASEGGSCPDEHGMAATAAPAGRRAQPPPTRRPTARS